MSELDDEYADAAGLDSTVQLVSQGEAVRLRLAALAERIAHDPAAFSEEYRLEDMEQAALELQQSAEEKLDMVDVASSGAQQVYGDMGVYRGLLGAYCDAVRAVVHIDWRRLGEARF